jgi:hypothetical protein
MLVSLESDMHPRARTFELFCTVAALAVCFCVPRIASGGDEVAERPSAAAPAPEPGMTFRLTREAVLNGVTLARGTELRISSVKKDDKGEVTRVDLEQVDGDKKAFKGIAVEALSALTAAPTAGAASGDRASAFKVAAQIPIIRELSLGSVVFARGSVLSVERVVKDKTGKVTKLDLRETSGLKRRVRDLPVDKLLLALSPDDVTWADGEVGRMIQLGRALEFGGSSFAKGTKLLVTRVETEPKTGSAVRVDLREVDGQKREIAAVPVALLKQNGAVGTAVGTPR